MARGPCPELLGGLEAAPCLEVSRGTPAVVLRVRGGAATPLLTARRIQAALGGLLAALVPRARIVPAVDPNDMNPGGCTSLVWVDQGACRVEGFSSQLGSLVLGL